MKDEELKKICNEFLDNNPDKVNNYKLGKTGLIGLFAGEVMKRSKGTADPRKIVEFLKETLNN